MKKQILIITLLVLMALAMIPVQATTWNTLDGSVANKTHFYVTINGIDTASDDAWWVGDGSTVTVLNLNSVCSTWIWTNPNHIYYSKIRVMQAWGVDVTMVCNGVSLGGVPPSTYTNMSVSGSGPITCGAIYPTETVQKVYFREVQIENGTPPAPNADFVGTPLNGTTLLTVVFTDTSTNVYGTATYNWSISPIMSGNIGNSGTNRNQTTLFMNPGNYTVSHGVETPYGSDIETKVEYITALNSSVLGTLYITAINSLTGYPIQGATLNLNDVENSSWVNATTATGTSQITGIKTHTVNVYASSPGFADNDKLGIPISNVYDSILLFPANVSNVSAGNVTLFVSVYEGDEHSKPIPNAGVNVIGPNGGSGQYTNSGGTAQFMVANKTTYLIDVQATGHRGASTSVYSGTGSGGSASVTVTVYLDKNTVTPTVTQTTLPGGGTPTPTITVLPGCELDPSSPECQASQNNEAMAWISANGMGLVQFFVLCFIVFMIKGMGKR
jgi:PKD repeat protein